MAQALLKLYPGAKLTIGPAISGFYYDVDLGEQTLSEKDFPDMESKMIELARKSRIQTAFGEQGGSTRYIRGQRPARLNS